MYANGMSMRTISRVLGTPRYCIPLDQASRQRRFHKLVEFWDNAEGIVCGKVITKAADEIRTYLFSKARAFHRLFTRFPHTVFSGPLLLSSSPCNRDEGAFREMFTYPLAVSG
jgi:hypothetical protein